MARETKFGLLFVLLLASTFGFLVFKRLHQPLALMAESETEALDEELSDLSSDLAVPGSELASADGAPSLQVSTAEPIPRPVSPTSSAGSTTTALSASNGVIDRSPLPAASTPNRPALPADLDDDFFAAPVTDKAPSASPAPVGTAPAGTTLPRATALPQELADDFPPTQPAVTMSAQPTSAPSDPFDFPDATAPTAATSTPAAPAKNPAAVAFDPFADGPAVDGPQTPARTPVAANAAQPTVPNPKTVPSAVPVAQDSPATPALGDDPFSETTPIGSPKTSAQPSPAVMEAPATVSAADPFADPEPNPAPANSPPPVVVTTPQPEDFFDAPGAPKPKTASVPFPAAELPIDAGDPFDAQLPVPAKANPPTASAVMTEPALPTQGFSEEELGGFRPVRVSDQEASSTTVIQRQPALTADPDPFDATPVPVNAPVMPLPSKFADAASPAAPVGRIPASFDEFSSAPPNRSASPVMHSGEAYVVQPSDSFWTISKRVYGTGRYFRALAKHNESTIGDPEKLRPNMMIATPPAADLDRLYRAEIPLAASSAVQQIREGDPARYQPEGEPGFFIHSSGQPMYRVGSNDTLSDIAYNHLGRASRWIQVFEMNRDILKDGNTLSIGTVLKLPGDASQVRVVGFESSDR